MTATNDFLPFCPTDTGTNLLSQADYAADPQLAIGNQAGVARLELVNKALRQSTYIASCLSQFLANQTGNNVLDDATPSEVITTMNTAFRSHPTVQRFLSGSGTYTKPANVLYLRVRAVGGGASGGNSSAATGGDGLAGGDTTFGTSLLIAGGGLGGGGGNSGILGVGGTPTVNSPAIALVSLSGGTGGAGTTNSTSGVAGPGGMGASSFFGGAGSGNADAVGGDAIVNSGSGGGGGGYNPAVSSNIYGASGGGAGAYIEAQINSPSATYAYSVGAGGLANSGGSGTLAGGAGGSGFIEVTEYYQ